MQPKIQVIGNAGKDAEYGKTQNGKPMLKFSLATKQRVRGTSGEEKTMWWNVTAFGTHADFHKGILKGDKVFVTGRFEFNEYAKQDGSRGYGFEITADDVEQATHRWPDEKATSDDLDSLPF